MAEWAQWYAVDSGLEAWEALGPPMRLISGPRLVVGYAHPLRKNYTSFGRFFPHLPRFEIRAKQSKILDPL